MQTIAKVQSQDREKNQIQDNIKAAIQPVLNNPLVNGAFLSGKALQNGTTSIPHGLGRLQQGFLITDIDGAAQIYRSAAFNSQNLVLTSNAAVTVSIYVF